MCLAAPFPSPAQRGSRIAAGGTRAVKMWAEGLDEQASALRAPARIMRSIL